MDEIEAKGLLHEQIDCLRALPYKELCRYFQAGYLTVDAPETEAAYVHRDRRLLSTDRANLVW